MEKNLIMAWSQTNASYNDTVNKIVVQIGNKKYFFDTQKEHILESRNYKPIAFIDDHGYKTVKLAKEWNKNSTRARFVRYFLIDEANLDLSSTKDIKNLIKSGRIEIVDEITLE